MWAGTMETDEDRNSGPEPEQSAAPGSDLLLGSASSLLSPETGASLSPAPPADWPLPSPAATLTSETSASPAPADGPVPSGPATDTWVTSQLLAPPTAACHGQLIIVEPRGQALLADRMVIVTGQSEPREVFVIPTNQLPGSQLAVISSSTADSSSSEQTDAGSSGDVSARVKLSGAPSWALRLRNVQKLGDSYRGFCCSEAELESVLLLHKQQTGAVFGTRQSPSADKPATRLMWRSQYVPYDGVPFVNTGSRAIVMECQFGPRRRGQPPSRSCDPSADACYRATCPARIYIKKVRKFPEFRVPTEPTADRRTVRQEQEKAFQGLRGQDLEAGGVVRFYLQLPTDRAHLYHTGDTPPVPPPPPDLPPPPTQLEEEEEESADQDGVPSRLHPRVSERITQLVAAGHQQVYSVRKQLRRFVEKELFKCDDGLPERHNLRYFPTVNDIRNHIHESQKALGLTAAAEWTEDGTDPLQTVTLTPAEVRDGDSLCPEAVQLFSSVSSLQPDIFAQLQGILPPPPPPPPAPPPIGPSSSFQAVGGSAGARGLEEQLTEGGAQQENVQLHIINSPDTVVHVSELQVTDGGQEEQEEEQEEEEHGAGS